MERGPQTAFAQGLEICGTFLFIIQFRNLNTLNILALSSIYICVGQYLQSNNMHNQTLYVLYMLHDKKKQKKKPVNIIYYLHQLFRLFN